MWAWKCWRYQRAFRRALWHDEGCRMKKRKRFLSHETCLNFPTVYELLESTTTLPVNQHRSSFTTVIESHHILYRHHCKHLSPTNPRHSRTTTTLSTPQCCRQTAARRRIRTLGEFSFIDFLLYLSNQLYYFVSQNTNYC